MKIVHIYPRSCEYAYPKYLDPNLNPDKFDLEIMCNTDLEVRYLQGLHELGEECVLFYPRRFHLPIKEFTHRAGYRIVRFPITFFEGLGDWNWQLPLAMLKHIKKEKPDLVHFHGILGGRYLYLKFFEIVAFFCKINKIPFFGWYHMGAFPKGRRIPILWIPARFFKTAALRSCAGITSINRNALRRLFDPEYPEYFGIDFSSVPHRLTPNTFDSKIFHHIPREEALVKTGMDRRKRYILMVARLCYEKGLHYLLNIMPELVRQFPDVHLLIVGEFIEGAESYKKKIKQLIKDLNIQDHVTFKGRVEHHQGLLYYYNVAEVFVLPTFMDSFAAVNLEAMACGLPVISTDREEIPYYLKPGVGILIPEHDEKALFEAIDRVLSGRFVVDEEERDRILAKYDYRVAAKSLKNWYEKILRESRS